MEDNIGFKLKTQIYNWYEQLKRSTDITASDSEELKCHLLDSVDHWQEVGLDEEEAFWVSSRRLSLSFEIIRAYREENISLIQMKRTVLVLSGVLGFFFSYYFLFFSSMLLFYGLTVSDIAGYVALRWLTNYLNVVQIALIISFAGIFFMEKKFVPLIRRIRLKPKHTILLLTATLFFASGKQYLYSVIREICRSQPFWGQLYDVFFNFRFSFPFLFCLSFVLLFWKYNKKLTDPAEGNNQEAAEEDGTNNLAEGIDKWCEQQKSTSGTTGSNAEQLKVRLTETMNELKALKLTGEEAFGIAVKRLGTGHFHWEDKTPEVDDSKIQMKRSFLILSGALAYFLFYYFFGFTSKLFFIILRSFDMAGMIALKWVSGYLTLVCFAFVFFSISIYFFEKKTLSLIESLEIKIKHIFSLFLTALGFGIVDTCLLPLSRNLMMSDDIKISFAKALIHFDYAFPLIICAGFVILYFRYYREITKI
ncbi:MAG: hypothetical protein ABFD10_22500 [Prolixibacteraceae bacterium]